MPFKIIRGDITKLRCDAIVNATDTVLSGGGGVDLAIHSAAGRELKKACGKLGGCKTGEAKITWGYKLPCQYVIHTVGPIWKGGNNGEEDQLRSCYKNSLALAVKYGCKSVAFPLISSGVYNYPKDKAINIAIDEISSFLMNNDDIDISIVVFDKKSYAISEKLFSDIKSYIDDNYAEEHSEQSRLLPFSDGERASGRRSDIQYTMPLPMSDEPASVPRATPAPRPTPGPRSAPVPCGASEPQIRAKHSYDEDSSFNMFGTLDEAMKNIDESFSQMLLRKIDEKGMTDAQCYKRANVDRKLFSKIRTDINYKPRKTTAVAFALALELGIDETKEMLNKAGYSLSRSSKFDIIVEYFINKGNYNVFDINEALFAFDQSLIGA